MSGRFTGANYERFMQQWHGSVNISMERLQSVAAVAADVLNRESTDHAGGLSAKLLGRIVGLEEARRVKEE